MIKISASMMCSKLIDLKETIQVFEQEKIDYLHIDIMDGEFVPNFGLGVDYIDGINLLTVNPGFAGQKIVPSTLKKAHKLQDFLNKYEDRKIDFEVDGNITPENGKILYDCGANIFVAGTSSIFKGEVNSYKDNILNFRNTLQNNM